MLKFHTWRCADGKKPGSIVILLHGLSGTGDSLLWLAHKWGPLLPNTEFICPHAPFPCEVTVSGREWFRWISPQDPSEDFVIKDIQTSFRLLEDLIESLIFSHDISANKIAIMGYSQGAMMCLYAAPRFSKQVACIVCYAGQIFGGKTLADEKKSSPPFLLLHGAKDPLVPASLMDISTKYLTEAEVPVQSIVRPELDHEFDEFGLLAGADFLKKALYSYEQKSGQYSCLIS